MRIEGHTDDQARYADLVRAVADKADRTAFAMLFERYAPRIKSMLVRMGTSPQIAEDIAQESMLAVWRKASYYDPARASVSAWIFTIARNQRIDRLRRDRRAVAPALYEAVEPAEPDRPDALLGAVERDSRVRDALQNLSSDQIRVVELSFFEGRAHADIADTLGIPLGTVKSRLRLAMTRLRDYLGDLK